jgi:hypothetical protein
MIAFEKVTFYAKKPDGSGVRHVFPVDSLANHDTAKGWATVIDRGKYDYDKRQYERESITVQPDIFEYENKGFDNVKIVDLYHRGNGGRAYQIVIEIEGNKFRMDFREDTMMEVLERVGIQAGGRLNGTYCLVKDGKETKLILEGTERHAKALKELESRTKNAKVIKKSELKVGYKYKTDGGSTGIYLGEVYTADIKDGVLTKPYKAMLWLDCGEDSAKKIEGLTNGATINKDVADTIRWNVKIKKSHTFKVEEKQVLQTVELDKYIDLINRAGQHLYDEQMGKKEWSGYNGGKWDMEYATDFYKLSQVKKDKKQLAMAQDEAERMENRRKSAVESRRKRGWGW